MTACDRERPSGGHELIGVADAGAFLARLVRLQPGAPVRIVPVPSSQPNDTPHVTLWGRLPWQALVTRTVPGRVDTDTTVTATELLAALSGDGALPPNRDLQWRWSLPPRTGRVVETVAGTDLVRVDAAAAGALRVAVETRQVGERVVRDALLDHVAIVVTDVDGARVPVAQRLVQAVLRMGFLGSPASLDRRSVRVCVAGPWTGLIAPYGTAWLRQVSEIPFRTLGGHPNG